MPLPAAREARNLEWPPPAYAKYVRQIREWSAWWAGDSDLLRRYSAERRFWHRQADADRTGRQQARSMHAALAADIVTTSADLLFGEEIELAIPEPEATGEDGEHEDADEQGVDEGDASLAQERAAVEVTQARLDELREEIDLDGSLLVAAEVAAGLGGAWLRPAWDTTLADRPLLTVIDPEHVVPEYRMGVLVAVTFWEDVERADSGRVWRHLERHEVVRGPLGNTFGVILHGLYVGDDDHLGTPKSLTQHAATAGLDEVVEVPTAAGPIMPRYMPNMLPNRKHRRLPVGRSDFDGIEDELDAIDEAWTSLLRDIRLGVARLMVPEGTLERVGVGPGAGRGFNVDRELMVETDAAADEQGGKVALMQGSIRETAHLSTIRALVEQAVSGAGYAPATFGLGVEGQPESGTAREIRERKTFRTLGKKRRYAERAIADVCLSLLAIDADVFGREIVPMRPRIGWPAPVTDTKAVADRLVALRSALAISIENAVREAQPDLAEPEVEAEVARIMAENSLTDPEAFMRDTPGGGGDPVDDPEAAA